MFLLLIFLSIAFVFLSIEALSSFFFSLKNLSRLVITVDLEQFEPILDSVESANREISELEAEAMDNKSTIQQLEERAERLQGSLQDAQQQLISESEQFAKREHALQGEIERLRNELAAKKTSVAGWGIFRFARQLLSAQRLKFFSLTLLLICKPHSSPFSLVIKYHNTGFSFFPLLLLFVTFFAATRLERSFITTSTYLLSLF